MTDAEMTQAMIEALRKRSEPLCSAEEVQLANGRSRVDFLTIDPHKSHEVIVYELKASRADFRNDSKEKQKRALAVCNRFFYVAPKDMIRKDEVPEWAGLLEYCPKRKRPFMITWCIP